MLIDVVEDWIKKRKINEEINIKNASNSKGTRFSFVSIENRIIKKLKISQKIFSEGKDSE